MQSLLCGPSLFAPLGNLTVPSLVSVFVHWNPQSPSAWPCFFFFFGKMMLVVNNKFRLFSQSTRLEVSICSRVICGCFPMRCSVEGFCAGTPLDASVCLVFFPWVPVTRWFKRKTTRNTRFWLGPPIFTPPDLFC